ncbi:MAG: hypothetical protein QXE96_00040 [Candidatus Caldarchaeum sp.]
MILELYRDDAWVDVSAAATSLRWRLEGRSLEALEAEVLDHVDVGERMRLRLGSTVLFEGVVYEVSRRHQRGDVARCIFTAHSDLILYDRHIVFREYPTGTTAGAIIRDLASLEQGVDVTEVDEGPALTSSWSIENVEALKVMQDIAKATNHWLRMRPGKKLLYKPKTTSSPVASIDMDKILSAEYSEDRWRLRNRVVYVGTGGEVLADVSTGLGDFPLVVHDPFLTDGSEALRRAQTRLNMASEYGRSLRLQMHQQVFSTLGIDLGDTVTVNLPSLGIDNENLYILEIRYDIDALLYEVVLGGRLELLEDLLDERFGGDPAARFGQRMSAEEAVGNAIALSQSLAKRFTTQLIPVLFVTEYAPPIPYASGQNIVYNDVGEVVLASGFTSGMFTLEFMPSSENAEPKTLKFAYDSGGGSVTVNLKRGDGSVIKSNASSPYNFPYIPQRKTLAEKDASKWSITGGTLSDTTLSIISRYSLKATGTTAMTLTYPATGSLAWNLSECSYFNIYVYPPADTTIEVRALTNTSNHYSAQITVSAGKFQKYVKKLSDFAATGTPSWSNINQLQIILPAGTYYIDFDHVFTAITYEKLVAEVNMNRPSASSTSPTFKRASLFWAEVTQT